jgi:hypothetical protein
MWHSQALRRVMPSNMAVRGNHLVPAEIGSCRTGNTADPRCPRVQSDAAFLDQLRALVT